MHAGNPALWHGRACILHTRRLQFFLEADMVDSLRRIWPSSGLLADAHKPGFTPAEAQKDPPSIAARREA